MENYKFYTPQDVADSLLALLPNRKYKNAIDICCGSWNLLKAARKRLSVSNITGIDVDRLAEKYSLNNALFICEEGRKFALECEKQYDLILSNPPFGYLKDEERKYKELWKNGNDLIIKSLCNKRYENEMMQANLLLASKGAVLLFILPSTFFVGNTFLKVRKELCEKYTVDTIVRLPLETFGSSRINTFAMIMQNIGPQGKKQAQYKKMVKSDKLLYTENIKKISAAQMKSGEWIERKHKRESNINIYRGNISSGNMTKCGEKVFHSSSCLSDKNQWYPSVRYCDNPSVLEKAKKIEAGDILINRVGRYTNYWCIAQEAGLISDCLIAIQTEGAHEVIEKMEKNSKNGKLILDAKGVAAKYTTIQDILQIL